MFLDCERKRSTRRNPLRDWDPLWIKILGKILLQTWTPSRQTAECVFICLLPSLAPFLDTGTHLTWRARHTSLLIWTWFKRHDYRAYKTPCHGFSVWCAIGIQSRGPGCMSSSESDRIKPERRKVHDLPNIIGTAPGSPHGELLMAALSATSILVSCCHVGEKFDPKVSDNHIPSFFSPRKVWDSDSWHPGTSDLSWFYNGHQSQLPHSMSGCRPKWFVM